MTKTYNDIEAVTRLLEEVRDIFFHHNRIVSSYENLFFHNLLPH